jgi:hypothetical protein
MNYPLKNIKPEFGNTKQITLLRIFNNAEKLDPDKEYAFVNPSDYYDIPVKIATCPYCHGPLTWSPIEWYPEDLSISEVEILCKNLDNCTEEHQEEYQYYVDHSNALTTLTSWIILHYRVLG